MAIIAPLKGVRYDPDTAGPLEDIVAPPYDVVSKNEEASYASRSPFNIIRLDITSEPGWQGDLNRKRSKKSADLFDRWLKEGVLLRDQEPSFYPYDITYQRPDGSLCIRRGFVCLVQLTAFDQGEVKPHAHAFRTVIDDRLELTRHCRAQFGQVLSLFSDPHGDVIKTLDDTSNISISTVTDANGNIHTLRKVVDKDAIVKIQNLIARKNLYIADGHHRYLSALAYQKELKRSGTFSGDRPENFIMMCLSPMEDNGLLILPAHRLIKFPGPLTASDVTDRLQNIFDLKELKEGSRETIINDLLSRMDEEQLINDRRRTCFGFYHPGEDRGFMLKLMDSKRQDLKRYQPSLRELDVIAFSEFIVDQVLQLDEELCEQENLITFHRDTSDMLDISVKMATMEGGDTPLLFLLNRPRLEQVKNLSEQGQLMPPKSTCFFPELVSGLVLNRLIENEKILIIE